MVRVFVFGVEKGNDRGNSRTATTAVDAMFRRRSKSAALCHTSHTSSPTSHIVPVELWLSIHRPLLRSRRRGELQFKALRFEGGHFVSKKPRPMSWWRRVIFFFFFFYFWFSTPRSSSIAILCDVPLWEEIWYVLVHPIYTVFPLFRQKRDKTAAAERIIGPLNGLHPADPVLCGISRHNSSRETDTAATADGVRSGPTQPRSDLSTRPNPFW